MNQDNFEFSELYRTYLENIENSTIEEDNFFYKKNYLYHWFHPYYSPDIPYLMCPTKLISILSNKL